MISFSNWVVIRESHDYDRHVEITRTALKRAEQYNDEGGVRKCKRHLRKLANGGEGYFQEYVKKRDETRRDENKTKKEKK